MSMNLSVYVGPYLEVSGVDMELIEEFEHCVTDGRGELSWDEGMEVLIPNVKLPGVSRQMSFDKYSDMPAIGIDFSDQDRERVAFAALTEEFQKTVRDNGGLVVMRWGVVCGMF